LDVWGDHAIQCGTSINDTAQDLTARHNSARDILHSAGKEAGWTVSKEEKHLLIDGSNSKPADVFIRRFRESRDLAVDVHIRHSLTNLCKRTQFNPDHILFEGENFKKNKYAAKCAEAGFDFAPFVMGTFGGFGPEAKKLMQYIAEAQSSQVSLSNYSESQLLRFLRQKRSVAVQRDQANAILKRGSMAGVLLI
jgi:hypothetical protein